MFLPERDFCLEIIATLLASVLYFHLEVIVTLLTSVHTIGVLTICFCAGELALGVAVLLTSLSPPGAFKKDIRQGPSYADLQATL